MNLQIRQATVHDVNTIVDILIRSKVESLPELTTDHDRNRPFWLERWRLYIEQGSTAQKSRGDGFVWIAELDGLPVGFIAYHHTERHDTEAEIQSLYVLKSAQRTGVGSALLMHVVRLLKAEPCRLLCVGYDPNNPYRAFYLKHGAVEINPHWAVWWDLSSVEDSPKGA